MNFTAHFQQAQQERDNGKFDQAIVDYETVRENSLKENDLWLAAECLHMIGVAYYQQDNYQQANNFLDRAEQEFLKINKPDFVAIVQRDQALISYKQKDLGKAKDLLQKSILGLDQLENKGQVGMSKAKLGVIQAEEGDLDKAEQTLSDAITILEKTNDQFFLSSAYFDWAKICRKAGKIPEAKMRAEKAMHILEAISPADQFQMRRKELQKFLQEE